MGTTANKGEWTHAAERHPQSGLPPSLAGQGLAACDGFAGLRALSARAGHHRTREVRAAQMAAADRWSLTGIPRASAARPGVETGTGGGVEIEGGAEFAARVLLDRYGVVFRRLCTREPWLPSWRELPAVDRRREAGGELRGGRFLALASGEQFALPEAVGLLREVRRRAKSLELVSLSAADPLNLVGIVTPGETVPRGSGRVLYLDGVPIASQSGREVRMSEGLDRGAAWEARKALLRRGVGATRLLDGRRRDHHRVGRAARVIRRWEGGYRPPSKHAQLTVIAMSLDAPAIGDGLSCRSFDRAGTCCRALGSQHTTRMSAVPALRLGSR